MNMKLEYLQMKFYVMTFLTQMLKFKITLKSDFIIFRKQKILNFLQEEL